jgi:hypothetical protein
MAAVLAIVSVGLAIPIFVTFFEQGIVPRLPTAVLSTGLMLLAFLSIVVGLVLDTVTKGRREMKLIAYLQQRRPATSGSGSGSYRKNPRRQRVARACLCAFPRRHASEYG